jgi:D-amino-acid dehydrogenase
MRDIAIIGAGITGITTAHALTRRGFNVTVYERHPYAAMETSFANGGQLSASNGEVWTHWSTVLKGLKWMLRPDAPLLVNPMPTFAKYGWFMRFMANIPNYKRNTIETVRLAIQAREALLQMAESEGVSFDLEKRGILHFYTTKAAFDGAAKVNELYLEAGLDRRAVTPEEMKGIEPALSGDFYGGYFTPSDMTGDIHTFTIGLSDALRAKGVAMRYGVEIADIRADNGIRLTFADGSRASHDGVVVCAGVRSRQIASRLGDNVPIYPVKGYSITIDLDRQSREIAPWVSLLDDKAKLVLSRLGEGRLRIAGTAEFNGANLDIRASRIKPMVDWVRTYFPGVTTEKVTPWAGLRPMMPSMMPKVGAGKVPGVFYNTGHGHLGWTLSGATAEIVADTALAAARDKDRPWPVKALKTAPL